MWQATESSRLSATERERAEQKAYEAKLAEFERGLCAEWVAQQRLCALPKAYDGVKLRTPPTEDDVAVLIRSFTAPEPAKVVCAHFVALAP